MDHTKNSWDERNNNSKKQKTFTNRNRFQRIRFHNTNTQSCDPLIWNNVWACIHLWPCAIFRYFFFLSQQINRNKKEKRNNYQANMKKKWHVIFYIFGSSWNMKITTQIAVIANLEFDQISQIKEENEKKIYAPT